MRKTLIALRHFSEIHCPEIRAMLVEFVHDFRLIELEAAPVQANTLVQTFAAQAAAAARAQANESAAQLLDGAVVTPVPQSPPTRTSLLELTPEAHSQPPFQVGSEMMVVGESIGDKRKSEQIAPPGQEGDGEDTRELAGHEAEKEDTKKQRAEVETAQDANLSSAKARKNMLQALNCRINSGRSSRCTSPAP